MISFEAIIGSRSSVNVGGPPGETEVLSLNPARRERILSSTGWSDLSPGSLNLEVADEWVHKLLLCEPLLVEDAKDIKYPSPYAHIPKLRVGYLYYTGTIKKGDSASPVLIRRACNPLKGRLEAFAADKLRVCLALSDGERVVCEIHESRAEQAAQDRPHVKHAAS
jgi:hypothetical protein